MKSQRESIGGLANLMFKDAYLYAQVLEGYIPDVFLQSEKYFAKYADFIKQRFSEGIGWIPYTAIHVRRGDYITKHSDFYVNLMETDYYKMAMALFPDAKFLVFSDDIAWCKEQDIFKDVSFAEGNSEHEDLNLMASCENVIMANSSFSWWASYLCPHPTKKIVAPKQWFKDGAQRVDLLDSWIVL